MLTIAVAILWSHNFSSQQVVGRWTEWTSADSEVEDCLMSGHVQNKSEDESRGHGVFIGTEELNKKEDGGPVCYVGDKFPEVTAPNNLLLIVQILYTTRQSRSSVDGVRGVQGENIFWNMGVGGWKEIILTVIFIK